MTCTSPKYIARRNITVGCGRCMACRINRTSQWAQRLMMELPYWEKACFITLTYDDDHLPPDGSLSTEEMPLFWKRVRKKFSSQKVKNFYCGEYGDEGLRCHYHAIVFGVDFAPWTFVMHKNGRDIFTSDVLADLWQHRGFVTVSDVTYNDCAYTAGYVQKKLYGKAASFYEERNWVPPFSHSSHGLSLDYVQDHKEQLLANQFVWSKGHKSPLPRYVSSKLGLLAWKTFRKSTHVLRIRNMIFSGMSLQLVGSANWNYNPNMEYCHMMFNVYAIFDEKMEEFSEPFIQRPNAVERSVNLLVGKSPVPKEDLTLWELGTWDSEFGVLKAFDKPCFVQIEGLSDVVPEVILQKEIVK